jgi:hypothetical protein
MGSLHAEEKGVTDIRAGPCACVSTYETESDVILTFVR